MPAVVMWPYYKIIILVLEKTNRDYINQKTMYSVSSSDNDFYFIFHFNLIN